jgi:hypothetical protein
MSASCNSSPVLSRVMIRHSVPCHWSKATHFWRPSFVLSLIRLMSLATEFQIRYFFSILPVMLFWQRHVFFFFAELQPMKNSNSNAELVKQEETQHSIVHNEFGFCCLKAKRKWSWIKIQKERQETTRKSETLHYKNTDITIETSCYWKWDLFKNTF